MIRRGKIVFTRHLLTAQGGGCSRALVAASILLGLWAQAAAAVTEGQAAPGFELPRLDVAEPATLARHRGEWVYVDFWASWCGPCARSFPWMNRVARDEILPEVHVIAVSVDRDRAKAVAFVERFEAAFTVARDPEGRVAQAYDVPGMPSSYLIGPDGTIRYIHTGFDTGDGDVLEERLKTVINEHKQ